MPQLPCDIGVGRVEQVFKLRVAVAQEPVESGPIFDVVEVERLTGTKDGCVFREVAVMRVVETVCRGQCQKLFLSGWTFTRTVNELARQHLHLPRPLAPIPQILGRDCRVRQVLLVDVLGVIIAFRPEHAIVLRFTLVGRAPGEKCASLSSQ